MRSFTTLPAALLCLVGAAVSTPTRTQRPDAQPVRVRQDPAAAQPTICGDIIDLVNQGFAYFYASDAFDCLTSVPFNPAVATRFIDYLNTTLQFQSTLAYLKDPPTGYQQRPVDVEGGLQAIKNNITTGYYQNQYAFEADVQLLLYATHDGHVSLSAGVLAAFYFLAPFSISSASPDGKALPKVYITDDIIYGPEQGWTPSAIKTINDKDTTDFLTDLANVEAFGGIEAHADYNQLFTTPALDIRGDNSILDGYLTFYPGDGLNVTFENDTTIETYWLAIYNEPYPTGPLTTGGDFYNYFVLGFLPASFNDNNTFNAAYTPGNDSTPINTTAPNSWRDASSGAYPDPNIFQPGLAITGEGVVSGYLLNDVDAAVLSIPSFDLTGWAVGNFTETVDYFITNTTQANLSRVVIDLQQNSGGALVLVFATFKQFFPDVDPFAGSRRRDHALGNILGDSFTAYFDGLTPDDADYDYTVSNEWVITPRLNADTGRNFSSWSEYYGPVEANGDRFSLTERYNLSSERFDFALFDGWAPYGYTPDNLPSGGRPFEASNIVLLTDGACASSCALFVELFTQAGARTVVVGGRPSTGPMQAVGGNKGAASYSADALDSDITTIGFNNDTAKALLPPTNDDSERDSGIFTNYLGINLRDQVRPKDTTPLQFKYEAADCRIFYSLANVYNMSRLWRDAVTASLDDNSLCVEGSTGYSGNSSKPAPAPLDLPVPTIDPGNSNVAEINSELTGGIQDDVVAAGGGRITSCQRNQACARGTECRLVSRLPCSFGRPIDTHLCLPAVANRDRCPRGTLFQPTVALAQKVVGALEQAGSRGRVSRTGSANFAGFCQPTVGTPLLGCSA